MASSWWNVPDSHPEIPPLLESEWNELWNISRSYSNLAAASFDVGYLSPASATNSSLQLKVVSNLHIPWVLKADYHREIDETIQKKCLWSGSFIRTLSLICYDLGIRCQIRYNDVIPANNVFSKTLVPLVDGSARLAITTTVVNGSRTGSDALVTLVPQGMHIDYSMIMHKSHIIQDYAPIGLLLGHLLDPVTWACFALAIVIILSILVISTQTDFNTQEPLHSWYEVTWIWFYRMLCADFEDRVYPNPLLKTYRIVLIATWFSLSMLLTMTLTANLPAVLAVTKLYKAPFATVKELLDSSFVIYAKTSDIQFIQLQNSDFSRKLCSRITPNDLSKKELRNFFQTHAAEKFAFLISNNKMQDLGEFTCDYMTVFSNVTRTALGAFWFRKGDPLIKPFEIGLLRYESSGVIAEDNAFFAYSLNLLRNLRNPKSVRCASKPIPENKELQRRQLSTKDLRIIFTFWIGSIICGFVILLFERFIGKMKNLQAGRRRLDLA